MTVDYVDWVARLDITNNSGCATVSESSEKQCR